MEIVKDNSKNKPSEKKELSREELLNILHQMSEQDRKLVEENKKLRSMLEEVGNVNFFKRIDYLFDVIKDESVYFTSSFKEKCSLEIMKALFEESETK